MLLCWSTEPAKRPRFSGLVTTLSGLLEREAGYLNLFFQKHIVTANIPQSGKQKYIIFFDVATTPTVHDTD